VITFTFDGLDETVAEFRETPATMTREARAVIGAEGQDAANEIRAQYPSVSGEMRAGVGVETINGGEFYAGVRVVSRSLHATWYEYGTAMRHDARGAFRGRVTPHPIFIRTVITHRARIEDADREILARAGLRVI
jgi:hypothetical protein